MKVSFNLAILSDLAKQAEDLLDKRKEHLKETVAFTGYNPMETTVYINGGRQAGHTTAAMQLYSYRPHTAVILPNAFSRNLFEDNLPNGITGKHIFTSKYHVCSTGIRMHGYKLVIVDQASSIPKNEMDVIKTKYADSRLQTQFLLLG